MSTNGARAALATQLPPLRVLPVPDTRPPALDPDIPFAAQLALSLVAQEEAAYVQDALAFDTTPRRGDLDAVAERADLPDPGAWLHGIAQSLLEVMAGLRHPSHVVRICSADVYIAVARRHASAVRRAGAQESARVRRMQVRRVLTTRPSPSVAEASVVLVVGGRVRAMALRTEAGPRGWTITALELA